MRGESGLTKPEPTNQEVSRLFLRRFRDALDRGEDFVERTKNVCDPCPLRAFKVGQEIFGVRTDLGTLFPTIEMMSDQSSLRKDITQFFTPWARLRVGFLLRKRLHQLDLERRRRQAIEQHDYEEQCRKNLTESLGK